VSNSHDPLTSDALAIWHAGLRAVQGDNLVRQNLQLDSGHLVVNDSEEFSLRGIKRLIVLGAGKAAASMADGVENFWRESALKRVELTGWVNIPAESESTTTSPLIHRHVARPFGMNEPTLQGCLGANEILRLAREATAEDLVICLISGGASALMPCPIDGISLQDKLAVTRLLSRGGANIEELNSVRACLSSIKAGGLAEAAARASSIVTLIISDILGDPTHLIGGGPTVLNHPPDFDLATRLIERFDPNRELPTSVYKILERRQASSDHGSMRIDQSKNHTFVIGNNATAVDAAGVEAVKRGYAYLMESSPRSEGDVTQVAKRLAHQWKLATKPGNPNCIISGGEPTVKITNQANMGLGGRNQHLALEVLSLMRRDTDPEIQRCVNMALVSGGTDGEDGPTQAAGAILNESIVARMKASKLDEQDYLQRFDSYNFFEQAGGLLVTGPTGTNVCDLRVALAKPT
jgi:glycerate 2-kinase